MNKDLFVALETGDVGTIQILHHKNPHVLLHVTFEGDTPLHIAAREGHLNIVEWILQVEPSFAGARNKDKNMPLHEAAKCRDPDLVRILLHHKRSSAYYYNKFRETALVIASKYGRVETVKLLLEERSYNDASEMHRSLRVAAYRRYADFIKYIDIRQYECEADEAKAILRNFSNIFKIFGLPTFMVPNLHDAVHGGDLEIVKAVLNSSSDLMTKEDGFRELMTKEDGFGRCAIHIAVMKGLWDIIDEFMFRWPDSIEIRNSDHKSVLHFAVEYNQFEMVKNLLLKKSPQKVLELELMSQDQDRFHNTPLHFAAKNEVDPEV